MTFVNNYMAPIVQTMNRPKAAGKPTVANVRANSQPKPNAKHDWAIVKPHRIINSFVGVSKNGVTKKNENPIIEAKKLRK